jgi:uncharacterized membrane protein
MGSHFEIPRLRTLAPHAGRHLLEATLIPLALFYGAVTLFGTLAALLVALGWSYLAIARRVVLGRRVSGLLLLGAFGLTARTLVAIATGSVFLYFLQPTLTNVAVAAAFLVSIPAGSPMTERLAADFCPLPEALLRDPLVRRFFRRLTLLWAGVLLANASIAVALLVSQPMTTYLWTKPLASWLLTGIAIAVSVLWFKRVHGRTTAAVGAYPL